MSGKRRWTIRNPHFLRRGAGRNAMRVDNCFEELVIRKKREVNQLIWDLLNSKAIASVSDSSEWRRSLFFRVSVGEKIINLKFIIWTGVRKKYPDYTNSQTAKFVLRVNENIEDVRIRVLNYLEAIEKGSTTEYVYTLALEELKKEHKIFMFYKTGAKKDKEGADFIIMFFKEGKQVEIPYQVKSSYESLMIHKDKFPDIPGSHGEFTGSLRENIDKAKIKIVEVINAYKEGKISFV